jgi:SAM-dependent methyltransferase
LSRRETADPDAVWAEVMPLWNALHGDDADVGLYRRLVRRDGARRPVVELGVGYGRVARHVLPDVGVDASAGALRRCALLAPAVRLLAADVADYTLPEPAGFSYAPQNLLSLLPDGAPPRFFAAVWRNTRPGGRFAFDAAVPRPDRLPRRPAGPVLRGRVGRVNVWYRMEAVCASPGHGVRVEVHHALEWVDPAGRVEVHRDYPPLSLRYREPDRVRCLLEEAGWVVEHVWGGFDGRPLTRRSSRQVWLVRRP